jgi:hypothetical protein
MHCVVAHLQVCSAAMWMMPLRLPIASAFKEAIAILD